MVTSLCSCSVEKLFIQLVETGHPALEPLVVTPSGILSIKHDYLFDPKAIYALFYVHGSVLILLLYSFYYFTHLCCCWNNLLT